MYIGKKFDNQLSNEVANEQLERRRQVAEENASTSNQISLMEIPDYLSDDLSICADTEKQNTMTIQSNNPNDQHNSSSIEPRTLQCFVCNKKTNNRCSLCKIICYCSVDCQRSDHQIHKQHCDIACIFKSIIKQLKETGRNPNNISFNLPQIKDEIEKYSEEKCWQMLEQYSKMHMYFYSVVEPWLFEQNQRAKKKCTPEGEASALIFLEEFLLLKKVKHHFFSALMPTIIRLHKNFPAWSNFKAIELELRKRKLNIYLFPFKNEDPSIDSFDFKTRTKKNYCIFIALASHPKRIEKIKEENNIVGKYEELLQLLESETGMCFYKK